MSRDGLSDGYFPKSVLWLTLVVLWRLSKALPVTLECP